ncbi:GNAT family N-acetyltransferase [Celeribacter marinus]|uniref:N-acetyltransferase n=1 Tax=Celeribacter marinus TaxID=1397108 RepID=A0A0P0A7G0_9RHOB|nr:GNAT family N-acetyltransferase [Celeribacter marinus]ALI54312.1 N-acetyltransferase [Celeribacter marinus]SFK35157.1 Acetyltransferase (GNAT) family protein [Celeribacter marinus]
MNTQIRHKPSTITIRPALWADKSRLLAMIGDLSRHHGEAATLDLPALVHLLKADMPWLKLLVAEQDGQLVGYAGVTGGMRLQFGERVMDLHHLFVDEAHRGRGIGRALINASHDLARTLGCGRITVGTMTTNIAAQKAYVACGFVPVPMTGKRFSMAVA